MIQANDFRRQWVDIREDALAAFDRVGASGCYVLGSEVRGFEAELAGLWGFPHAIGVASGMDAIEIALRAVGCGPGDRVLTTLSDAAVEFYRHCGWYDEERLVLAKENLATTIMSKELVST